MRVKSLDTDIFSILLCYAEDLSDITVMFDTGKENQRRLIDTSSLAKELTQQYCTALRVLHAFTGCNTTSTFKGKGKIRPIKLVKSKSSFIETFASLGGSWKVFEHTLVELEEFTCLVYKNKYTLKLSMTSDIACLKSSVVTKRSTQVSTWICQLYHLAGEV